MVEVTLDMESSLKGGFISYSEKRSGTIKRKVSLPQKVIPKEAKAKLEKGILKIEIPKLEKDELVNVAIN